MKTENITITEPRKERFRTIKSQVFHSIDEVDILDYEVDGYLQGERVDRLTGLSIAHFDQIQVIRKSTNTNNGGEYLHAIGFRKEGKQYTVLILKKKQIKP